MGALSAIERGMDAMTARKLRILHHMLAVSVLIALIVDVGHVMAEEYSKPDIGTIDRYIAE
jgi:hypothetical protein